MKLVLLRTRNEQGHARIGSTNHTMWRHPVDGKHVDSQELEKGFFVLSFFWLTILKMIINVDQITVQRIEPGPPKFFDQTEADSLTKNFDFVVFKTNEIQS